MRGRRRRRRRCLRLPARRQAFLQPHLSPLLRILPQILKLNLTHMTPEMGECNEKRDGRDEKDTVGNNRADIIGKACWCG